MFSIYKKDLQGYFFTPFAYIVTGLFLFMFTFVFNGSLGTLTRLLSTSPLPIHFIM
jgi:ABC-2 type transport system permease protein